MKRFACFLATIIAVICAAAQSDTTVTLITAFPGKDIYELEGHSAIRINMGKDRDYAISYGIFDFNASGFVYRFVKGETDYMVGAIPFRYFLDEYESQGRRVEELSLNLTSEQKRRLIDMLSENLKPENRIYRYNYVKDNCSIRPLKMIEKATGVEVPFADFVETPGSNPSTYRNIMRHYHRNYPWYQFGIDLALGSGIDYPITETEKAFVPMLMANQMKRSPLGGQVRVLVDFPADNAVEGPTPWYASPMFVCWTAFIVIAVLCIWQCVSHTLLRWLFAAYFLVLGLGGLLLFFLIFISVHEATSPNYLFIWLNPLCLVPVCLIWSEKTQKIVTGYMAVNAMVLVGALLAWPWVPQSANPAFLPLVLADLALSATYIYVERWRQNKLFVLPHC